MPAEDPEVAVLCDRRGRGRDLGVGVAAWLLGVQRLREGRHDVAVVVLGVAAEISSIVEEKAAATWQRPSAMHCCMNCEKNRKTLRPAIDTTDHDIVTVR